jgi:putative aldouronate transport system permease protein
MHMALNPLTSTQPPAASYRASTTNWRTTLAHTWKQHRLLYMLLLPTLIWLLFMRLYPFYFASIAFVKYNPVKGLEGSAWVGFKNFIDVFKRPEIFNIIRNTLVISLGKIFIVEMAGFAFALLIHEARAPLYKKFAQTVSAIPHFFSWVIVGTLVMSLLTSKGWVNLTLDSLGLSKVGFLSDKLVFPWTLIFSETWKEFGWSAVIYLAALTQINPELLEAAAVDGAGRGARLWYIILPTVFPTFVFMVVLGFGGLLDAGFEQVLVLYNPALYSTGDILDTYVYRMGLVNFKFELATVVGLVKSVVGYIAIMAANWGSGKLTNYRMF